MSLGEKPIDPYAGQGGKVYPDFFRGKMTNWAINGLLVLCQHKLSMKEKKNVGGGQGITVACQHELSMKNERKELLVGASMYGSQPRDVINDHQRRIIQVPSADGGAATPLDLPHTA